MSHPAPPAAAAPDPRDQPQALRLAADVWRAVCGHWRVAALFFLLANAAVLLGIMFCPRTYQSEAKLRVNPGRENATIDATASASGQVNLAQSNREQDLNTAVDILESRQVMMLAVARIGPEPILKGFVPEAGEVGDDAGGVLDPETSQKVDAGPLAAMGLSDPVSRFEKAVQTLNEIVEVNSNKKSDVISVSVEAEKPALAQRICSEVVDGFRKVYREASETEGSNEFFVEEVTEVKDKLDAASQELAAELNRLGISSVEGHRKQLQDELTRLTSAELDRRKELDKTLAEVGGFGRVLAGTPETIDAGQTANQATGAPDTLRREIAALEARRDDVIEKSSARAPGAVRLASQIAAAKTALTVLQADSDQTVTSPNPVWQDLSRDQLKAEAKADGLRAELAALDTQLNDTRAAVAALNDRESLILSKRAERDELAKVLTKYIENREQTRISDRMGTQDISSVRVFQEPTFNAKPVAPKKRLIAAAGLVFAAFGALGLCLVLEYKSVFFPHGEDGGAYGGAADPAPANGYSTVDAHARNGHAAEVPPRHDLDPLPAAAGAEPAGSNLPR